MEKYEYSVLLTRSLRLEQTMVFEIDGRPLLEEEQSPLTHYLNSVGVDGWRVVAAMGAGVKTYGMHLPRDGGYNCIILERRL